jgi:hypothetical protein
VTEVANTDDEYGNAHRWSGWPGAFCLNCHAEDPYERCLADDCDSPGHCICASMGDIAGPCRVIPEPCPAPGHYARWLREGEQIATGLDAFLTFTGSDEGERG